MRPWRIGEVTITKVVELEVTGGTRFVLPDATCEACRPISWMKPHFMDDDGQAAVVDYDKRQSTRTRHDVFSALAGTPTLLIGTHFAGATAGHVLRDGAGYRLLA